MGRWLTMRTANRAAWAVLAALALAAAGLALTLVLQRVTARRSDSSEATPTARPARAAPSSASPEAAPTVRTNGTLEQVQGQALVLREANGDLTRVLLRADATVTRETVTSGSDKLRAGDAIFISQLAQQQDNTVAVMQVTLTVPPPTVPQDRCGLYGTVVAVSGNRLTFDSACGRRELAVRRSVTVRRVEPVTAAALRAGQRAEVFGNRLPDGTVSVFQIQVTEMQ